jgi:ubiquitin related modifier 1
MSSPPTVAITVQFSGGLEYLFHREPPHPLKLDLDVPAFVPVDNSSHISAEGAAAVPTKPADVTYLIHHIRNHYLKERVELFMENGTLCVNVDSGPYFVHPD